MCKRSFIEEVKSYVFVVRDGKVFYTKTNEAEKKEIEITVKSQLKEKIMLGYIVSKKDRVLYEKFMEAYKKNEKLKNTYAPKAKSNITVGTDIKALREKFIEMCEEFDYLIKKVPYVSIREEIESIDIDVLFA